MKKAMLAAALLMVALASRLPGQAPAQLGTTDLKNISDQLVSQRKYPEAIPYLEELHTRIKDNTTPESVEISERIVFYLGLAHAVANQPSDAIRYLELYLEKFKDKNITRTVNVQDMLAEALFISGQYDKAGALYLALVNSRHTPDDRRRNARLNLIDSYISAKEWDKLVRTSRAFVNETRDPELQGRAAIALCQGYVQTDRPEKVFELIPILENSSSTARYRVDFNLAMIAAGDRLFGMQKYDIALPLYQIAASKRLIERLINERTQDLKTQKENLAAIRPVPPNMGTLMSSINGELKRLGDQLDELKEAESYDEELRMRIAQTFYNQGRRWEALWAYESLMDDFPESSQGEKAGYAAFALAAELGQRDRAIELGREHMEGFPQGENFETLSWQLTQLMVAAKEYDEAKRLADAVLKDHADHIMADKMLFLTGYSLFQEGEMERAAEMFLKVRTAYPQSESREAADFWYAMTYLYRGDYPGALAQFKLFAEGHTSGEFHADAIFRTGVCNYAMETYDEARRIFEDFLVKYPEAPQVAEAHLLLGDIAGNDARLDDALSHYAKVETLTVNQGNIDYATMAAGKVLEALERWDDMIAWFTRYLKTYGTSGLYAEAVYRVGFAKKQKGDVDGMLASYLEAIKEYGNDPNAMGVDLITRDWPKEYLERHGKTPDEIVRAELSAAQTRGDRTMAMRWLMMKEWIDAQTGGKQVAPLEVGEVEIQAGSPAILVWLGNQALAQKDGETARRAYTQVVEKFDQNEWFLPALMALAKMDAHEGKTAGAMKHYGKAIELFPQNEEAALAIYEQANLLAKDRKYAEAVSKLEQILEVKEWRGELWAKTIYRIGEILMEEGKTTEAFAYFQRVYVLYGGYPELAAKAYLRSANCLAALGKPEERNKTLQELVANQSLRNQPEYAEAQRVLSSN